MTCSNKDLYSEFQFPRKVEKTNSYGIQYYECCKTGSKVPPFIDDYTFKETVYPQIALSTVAVLSLLLLITALFIPLWLYLRESCKSTNNNNTTTTTDTRAFVLACSTANLYLNCVISYEVLTHLRNSYNTIRCDPPSLFKVTFQTALVYLFAIVVLIIHYVIGIEKQKRFEQGNFDRHEYLNKVDLYWSLVTTYIFPIVFFGYVWITISCCGYMSSATGEMKQVLSPTKK
ncbi:hypothetical protein FRACYDRAFT_244269 [Fragilariopsis cylindrus CCMP1102]|uniref:Uncharacterized protein n=1 Tax=Fragilariopsis cylindrus CCMP1102 TaxID=635003 RepID=A0A1E7F2L2_9STRA|nr:hypothetical protein FRACYDRAFT_244269 [Fragilariopsis cylindrus CCMP1102]|eukprot:OEU12063.1 hypothetical protein FRACYDRAFT_244269 [Fragilariopsis cylindrus CCMP1102]